MRTYGCLIAACAALVLPGCSEEVPLRTAIVGKWANVDQGRDTIEFRDDGSLEIAGQRKRDLIRGDYKFINDENVEMTFRFPEDNEWRPRWMPPGVRKDPLVRAYVRFFGDVLELRPRGRIQTEKSEQYVEFGVIRFDPVVEEEEQ